MNLDALPPHPSATYVLPRWKTVFVSVPKAACTSLKWLVADLQGEDPERFYRSVSREITRSMTIHRRSLWRKTPTLKEISEDALADISPDNGWFVFSVVRHPLPRMWSAWQSKLLLQEPLWVARFGDADWFPRDVRTSGDVVRAFQVFAAAVRADPTQEVMQDRHMLSQSLLLRPDRVPYGRIYRTDEIPALLKDLGAHVRAGGYDGPDLTLRTSNETPLPLIEAVLSPEVVSTVSELYAEDFPAFGYSMEPDIDPAGYDDYPDSVIAEVHRLVERSQRIGDLALAAQAGRQAPPQQPRDVPPTRVPLPTRARRFVRRKVHRR